MPGASSLSKHVLEANMGLELKRGNMTFERDDKLNPLARCLVGVTLLLILDYTEGILSEKPPFIYSLSNNSLLRRAKRLPFVFFRRVVATMNHSNTN